MDHYRYTPLDLDERSFRLLRLLKGNKGPIRCEIFHAQLDDTEDIIPYDALSYTWGDQSNLREIEIHTTTFHVDMTVLSVTENLHVALQHIRQREEDRILWIDAICINQENPKERGHQVKQMSSIYEKAIKVVFWLGKSNPLTQMAFDYMCELQKKAINHARSSWMISDERCQSLQWESKPSLNNTHDSWDEFLREGFKDLLARAWFRRAWIIQEVAQAQKAEVMCGAQSISARIFAVTAMSLEMEPEHHCRAILDIMPGPSRESSWWAGQRDLRTLLYKFRNSNKSDVRDAIYSLLGICSDKSVANFPTPDYGSTERDIIFKTLQYFVRFNGIEVNRYDLPWWRMDHFLDDMPWLEGEIFKWMVVQGPMDVPKMLLDTDQVGSNSRDRHGSTLLEWATRENRKKAVKLLEGSDEDELEVKSEATHEATSPQQLDTDEIEVDSAYGDDLAPQPLLWAAQTGNEAMFAQLLNTDDIDAEINRPDQTGSTPLSWAARNGHDTIARLLLNTDKIDVNLDDRTGSTPLLWAARNGHDTIIQLLLNKPEVDINLCNRNGSTPLLWAARNGHNTVVQLLLHTSEVDANLYDRNGSTPLLWAVRNRHDTIAQLLLDTPMVSVNQRDRKRTTPMHWAARNQSNSILRLLIRRSDSVVHRDQDGLTPKSWAEREAHTEIADLLRKEQNIRLKRKMRLLRALRNLR
jgi:ankyrin repeat protein